MPGYCVNANVCFWFSGEGVRSLAARVGKMLAGICDLGVLNAKKGKLIKRPSLYSLVPTTGQRDCESRFGVTGTWFLGGSCTYSFILHASYSCMNARWKWIYACAVLVVAKVILFFGARWKCEHRAHFWLVFSGRVHPHSCERWLPSDLRFGRDASLCAPSHCHVKATTHGHGQCLFVLVCASLQRDGCRTYYVNLALDFGFLSWSLSLRICTAETL
jgi:hypothetical protein